MPLRSQVIWDLGTARAARDIAATSATDVALRARVMGHTTKGLRSIGGASVRLQFIHAPLRPGGWMIGLGVPSGQCSKAFLPAIGGAPGGSRHGVLEAMVLARPTFNHATDPAVTFLDHEPLERYLPTGTELALVPIWQCMDFFDLRELFNAADTNGDGRIDKHELRDLLERATGRTPAEVQLAEIMLAADTNGNGTIEYDEFIESTGLQSTRLRLQLRELADRAAVTVRRLHSGSPWHGGFMYAGTGFEGLLAGTGLPSCVVE